MGLKIKDLMIITRPELNSRRSSKQGKKNQVWPCEVPGCNVILYSKSSRFRHQALHSKPGNQYQCGQCPSTFLVKLDLIDHERRQHSSAGSYVICEECDRTFSTTSNLNAHREIHNKITKPEHVCDMCDSAYFHRSALRRHQRNEHGRETTESSHSGSDDATAYSLSPRAKNTPLGDSFHCIYCSSTCTSEYEYQQHLGSEHFMSIWKRCLINNCKVIIPDKNSYIQHKLKHKC